MYLCVLVAQSCPTLCNPMDCSSPGSSVHGILQAKNWSGLPFPSPEDLPHPGIKPESPALQADSLLTEPSRKPVSKSPNVMHSSPTQINSFYALVSTNK